LGEYLVRHPKLPAQAGLIACIVVAAVIVSHYVGRIDVVRVDVASEPLTGESPALTTPVPPPAAQQKPADRPTDARGAQLTPAAKPPAPKVQAAKPQRSTIAIDNSSSRSRRAENPRAREIGRETSTVRRTGATETVIAPAPLVSAAAPGVPANVRPTATPSAPALPLQTATGNSVDYENSGHIYSAQDVDVRPPQMLEADLPRPAVTNWPTIKNSMEVVVMEDGSVERVKWLTNRERMPDVMLLSRAKLWKFSPAVRDGRAVRYRLIVTWEVNP
jgi:pyruvate/2-oxoglutarate dehydrogenase complex dihydrolipoamide acyltransferase (E2) component